MSLCLHNSVIHWHTLYVHTSRSVSQSSHTPNGRKLPPDQSPQSCLWCHSALCNCRQWRHSTPDLAFATQESASEQMKWDNQGSHLRRLIISTINESNWTAVASIKKEKKEEKKRRKRKLHACDYHETIEMPPTISYRIKL